MLEVKTIVYEYRAILIPTILFVTVLFVFWGILQNEFVYDDDYGILLNTHIIESSSFKDFALNPGHLFNSNNAPGAYRPLSVWFMSLQIKFFGTDPFYFHLVSLVLHAVNTVFLFYFIRLLFRNEMGAFLVALLWGVHAVHVESVAWAFQQGTLWSLLFMLMSLMLALQAHRREKRIYYYSALVLALCAMLTKDQALVLPLLLLGICVYERVNIKRTLYLLTPFFLLLAILLVIRSILGVDFVQIEELDRFLRFLIMIKGAAYYILLMFWPNPLTVDYDQFLKIAPSFFWASTLLVYIAALFFVAIRTNRYIAFGMFWFFVGLAPVSNVIFPMIQFIDERFLYFPAIGFCIAIVFLLLSLRDLLSPFTKYAALVPFLVLFPAVIAYAHFSIERVKDWRSPLTLWESAYKVNPLSPRTVINYASRLGAERKDREALLLYLAMVESLDLKQWSALVRATLESTIRLGEVRIGNNVGNNIIQRYPEDQRLYHVYGRFLVKSKQYGVAEKFWKNVFKKFGITEQTAFYLSFLQNHLRPKEDIAQFTSPLANKSFANKIPQLLLGYNLLEQEQYENAINVLASVVESSDDLPVDEPYEWLAEAYIGMGDYNHALATYYQLLRLNPTDPDYEWATQKLLGK